MNIWLFLGVYSRKHLDTLVELLHETLKTLDTAAYKYGNPNAEKKKIKQKNVRDYGSVWCVTYDELFCDTWK